MKTLQAKTLNIERPLLGLITRKRNVFALKNRIYVSDEKPSMLDGMYEAVITSYSLTEEEKNFLKIPILFDVENSNELSEGDVVLISSDGNIYFQYEKKSVHNVIFVTERCNLSCVMCPQYIDKESEDRTEINLKLISLMDKKTESLAITGGEPTLLGDDLVLLINECKEKLPKTSVLLLTNGLRLGSFDYAKKIASVYHPNLTIAIPLYADTDKKHDYIVGAKAFHRVTKALYNLALLNIPTEIRVVITKLNYTRLPRLAEYIYNNFPFIRHVAFMGLETRESAEKNIDEVWIDPIEYGEELSHAVKYLNQRYMTVSIYNHQLCVLPKSAWTYSRKSISGWKNIYLDECLNCSKKQDCCGFFASNKEYHSGHIAPIEGN